MPRLAPLRRFGTALGRAQQPEQQARQALTVLRLFAGALFAILAEICTGALAGLPIEDLALRFVLLFAKLLQVQARDLNRGFRADGSVNLAKARITRRLECDKGTFESSDLTDASAGAIVDDEQSWPEAGKLPLDGFAYGRISGGPVTAAKRLGWLARQTSFTRHPYRQLAKVLKEAGDDQGWRRVCVEMERRTWEGRAWTVRPLSYLLQGTIGYGYFSGRALWWLLALVIVGSLVYGRAYEAGSIVPTDKNAYDSIVAHKGLPAYYEAFHALPYSMESSFPLVKFGVQDKWAPGPGMQAPIRQPVGWTSRFLLRIASPRFLRCFRWVQICAGWILATLFVGGVTGVVRKD